MKKLLSVIVLSVLGLIGVAKADSAPQAYYLTCSFDGYYSSVVMKRGCGGALKYVKWENENQSPEECAPVAEELAWKNGTFKTQLTVNQNCGITLKNLALKSKTHIFADSFNVNAELNVAGKEQEGSCRVTFLQCGLVSGGNH